MKNKIEWIECDDGFRAVAGGIILTVLQSPSKTHWQWWMNHRVAHIESRKFYEEDPEWALADCEAQLLSFARSVLRQLSKEIREREDDEARLLHQFENEIAEAEEKEDAEEKVG